MSEPPPPVSTSAADPAPQAAAARRAGRGGFWLSVVGVIALAALGLGAWQTYNSRQEAEGLRQELAKRLADVDAQSKAARIAGDQMREATREASVKIGVLESKLAESQSQQIALESLYQDLSRNRDEWAFAEIEQTLLVASQQLQLAGNVKAALIALQAADTRLQHMNRPQLASLRKAINDDVARLKAAPFVDTVGLSVRIDTVVAAVGKLPLAAETRAPGQAAGAMPEAALDKATSGMDKGATAIAQGETAWSRFWREIWTDLRQLVRVQRIGNADADVPLLAPTQAYFLRENLKLRLLTARMALLTRDQATFRSDLKAAQDWITRHFDTRDKAVSVALSSLAALQKSDVSIELPDLSATLAALRAVSPAAVRGKS
jgi:uroporphyrin-3 C-methyltransferase